MLMKIFESMRRKRFLLSVLICTVVVICFLNSQLKLKKLRKWFPPVGSRKKEFPSQNQNNLKNDKECKLPNLKLHDPTLAKFFVHVPPLQCAKKPNWLFVKDGRIFVSQEATNVHGKISCKLTQWFRKNDYEIIESPYDFTTLNGTPVKSDYFQAICESSDGTKFENFYSTIVPNQYNVLRLQSLAKKRKFQISTGLEINIYIWALESMSRLHVIRKLPKTYEFIQSLNPVILEGYNIVGDGTPQALIPMLTGKTEEELPLTRKRFKNASYVDVYPWIWNFYRDAGYVTLYGEDAYRSGTFQLRLRGFKNQPTNHYLRTFFIKVEPKLHKFQKFCIGGETQHKVFFRNSEEFFKNYPKNVKKFGFMFYGTRLSHEDLNTIETADLDFKEHLKWMKDSGHLDNTILIMVADHGHRFAQVRNTHQGQLEERMPFFGIAAPEWFKKKYWEAWKNLEDNRRKLVTPFDIHETLKVLLNWREPHKGATSQRANSIFDEIPSERSCKQAGVDPHWCVCLQWTKENVEDGLVKRIAAKLVKVINNETERARKLCSPLSLTKIESAKKLVPHKNLLKYKSVKDLDGFVPDLSGQTKVSFAHYQINFQTSPGHALYEATIECDMRVHPEKIHIDLNTVSHINQYGDKPHCVIEKDYFLAKWCVCYDKV